MIPADREAEILRLHHVEKWPIGTIAAQLHLHHSTVRRVLAQGPTGAGRFSLGRFTTDDEIDRAAEIVSGVYLKVRDGFSR